MAGITQLPLRLLAKEQGCALVVSEMISANGLVFKAKKTQELLRSHPAERPLSVQIFGRDPHMLRDAAKMVQDEGADIVDINLGCAVKKIVRQESGVALMQDEPRFQKVVQAVRKVLHIPLTIKIRSGWDATGDQAVSIGRIAQEEGVNAVAIHPRTAQQGFTGKADWSLIARLKDVLSLPVIGNGDIQIADDVLRMQRETGCDGIMIGRAAIGNPWIFSQAIALLAGQRAPAPDYATRLQATLRYIDHTVEHFGEYRAVRMMRSRLPWFIKGCPKASAFRSRIVRMETKQAMVETVKAYFSTLFQPQQEPAQYGSARFH
jgi:nifR3 family TIM-barrel protein